MKDEPHADPEHVFDQTNGAVPPEEGASGPGRSERERERRRAQSSALAYGMFGTGHQ